jgi:hypothetical protein
MKLVTQVRNLVNAFCLELWVKGVLINPVKCPFKVKHNQCYHFDESHARSIAFIRTRSACSVLRPSRLLN